MARQKQVKPIEYPGRMLKVLVKEYDVPQNVSIRCNGMSLITLAVKAGIVGDYEAQERISNTAVRSHYGNFVSEIEATLRHIGKEGCVEKRGSAADTYILPTVEGLRHGSWLLRPRYRKAFDAVKGDVRTVIVALITAAIVATITTLIMGV